MQDPIKDFAIFGIIGAVTFVVIFLMRSGTYSLGIKSLNNQKYNSACFWFGVASKLFMMEQARVYGTYCKFKLGKISAEKARSVVEESKMAYRDDGYQLFQRINQTEKKSKTAA